MMDPILRVEGLNKRFGGIVVADAVDLRLLPASCLGIIGPNGAGKTSLFNLLDGSIRPDSGRIFLDDTDVSGMPHYKRVRLGIARAYQIPQPFPDLTVFENVLTAAIFGAGLGMVWTRYLPLLADPLASSFGTLLSLKILLALSVLGHFFSAMFLLHSGRMNSTYFRRIHLSVFSHMVGIVLLAKGMFYLSW